MPTQNWEVTVEKISDGVYETKFRVEHQYFRLAYIDEKEPGADPGYAKAHCEFVQEMFLVALERLGVKK